MHTRESGSAIRSCANAASRTKRQPPAGMPVYCSIMRYCQFESARVTGVLLLGMKAARIR